MSSLAAGLGAAKALSRWEDAGGGFASLVNMLVWY